ncbi:MAG: hypothetical protein ABIP02_04055, partial [Arenimonas sp.]
MKLSSTWQIALAFSLLLASAGAAIFLNPASQKTSIKKPETIEVKQPGNSFVVNNVRVFDGDKTIEKTTVLVQQGKIAAIGENIKIPDGTPEYEGAGKT